MSNPRPRILFFGRDCPLSTIPLAALLASGVEVAAIVSPKRWPTRSGPLHWIKPSPLAVGFGLIGLGGRLGVPIMEVDGLRSPVVRNALLAERPDLLVVSCFPYFIPGALRRAAHLGGMNVHPSLLPLHRGPDPLFWSFRHHDAQTGVTLHTLSNRLDAGTVLAQCAINVPSGIPGDQLEHALAERAAVILPPIVAALGNGVAKRTEQDEAAAGYESWPQEEDLEVPREWPAERAWSFVRGVTPLGYRTWVQSGGDRVWVARAIALSDDGGGQDQRDRERLDAAFRDGRVLFQLADV